MLWQWPKQGFESVLTQKLDFFGKSEEGGHGHFAPPLLLEPPVAAVNTPTVGLYVNAAA